MTDLDRLPFLESRLEELADEVSRLRSRVDALESHPLEAASRVTAPAAGLTPSRPIELAQEHEGDVTRWTMLVGRTFLVLGGGYLVRALTESEQIPGWLGVTLGLLYGLIWVVLAERSGAAGRKDSASFHGAAASMVAFPLIWEATVRFQQLDTWGSACLIALISILILAVAIQRQLHALSFLALAAGTTSGVVAMIGTRSLTPYALALTAVGLFTLAALERRRWSWLALAGGAAASLSVAIMLTAQLLDRGAATAAIALVPLVVLFVGYAGYGTLRCFRPGAEPVWLVAIQTSTASLLGYGGALLVARKLGAAGTSQGPLLALAILGVAIGLGLFWACSRLTHWRREIVEGTATLVFALGAVALAPEPRFLWLVLALGFAGIAARSNRAGLTIYAAALLAIGAMVTTLPSAVVKSLFFPPAEVASLLTDGRWMVLILTVAAALACTLTRISNWQPWPRMLDPGTRLVTLIIATLGSFTLAIGAAAKLLPSLADAGSLAVARTAVLALSVVGLAWAARFVRLQLSRWLVYPVLGISAIKLALQDFPSGRPVTLFLALLFFGGALIIAPRLLRSRSTGGQSTAGS